MSGAAFRIALRRQARVEDRRQERQDAKSAKKKSQLNFFLALLASWRSWRLSFTVRTTAIVACLATPVNAATPVVEYFFPAGGQQGTTVTFTTGSKAGAAITPWPAKVWTDCSGLEITAEKANGTFVAHIAKDAPLGPHLVRFYNADGATPPLLFVIGRHREVAEKEPNDNYRKPQVIADLPAVVNGRLEKPGDVDCYGIDVEAGRWLIAELECRRLGSPMDAAMRMVDENGVEVAFNDDTFGLDPLIAFHARKTGRYVLQLHGFGYPPGSNPLFFGSGAEVYRLNITTGPYARFASPHCVGRDRKSTLHLFGWNLGASEDNKAFGNPLAFEFDPAALHAEDEQAVIAPPNVDNILRLPINATPSEPQAAANNSREHPQPLSAPTAIAGRLDRAGDIRYFSVDAKAKEAFVFNVKANSLNSPLEPMLVITDPAGKDLVREVGGGQDIRLDWTATAVGKYTVSLKDLAGSGGGAYIFDLGLSHPTPDFSAKVDTASFRIVPGKTAKIDITVTKQGDPGPLKVEAFDLPQGVTATLADVPAKGPATLILSATADAKLVNQPFHITVHGADGAHSESRSVNFAIGPDQLIPATPVLWLTVSSSDETIKPAKKKK